MLISGVLNGHMRSVWRKFGDGAAGLAIVAFAAVLLAGLSVRPAHADFRVCNATQNLVGVAIGYRSRTGWISEGWWHIDGSACKTLIEGSLQSRYYYLFAEDAERGGRWEGAINMCVADKEFKIAGVNDCYARGFERAGFQEYDTGEQENWMVQLTDGQPAGETATITGPPNAPARTPTDAPATTSDQPAPGVQPSDTGKPNP